MSNRRMYYFGISLLIGSFLFVVQAQAAELSVLGASTFLGGIQNEYGGDILVTEEGKVFVSGHTLSVNFPTTDTPFDNMYNGEWDIFISELTPDLHSLLSSTFIGGLGQNDTDLSFVLGYDTNDKTIIVAGSTNSTNFPTTANAFMKQSSGNGFRDAYVLKLSDDLKLITGATLLGGKDHDGVRDLLIDNLGNILVVGYTQSTDFPVTSDAYKKMFSPVEYAPHDGFLTKLSSDLSQVNYSTLIGGNSIDEVTSITVDSSQNLYIAGITYSPNFSVPIDGYKTILSGSGDSFVLGFTHDSFNVFSGTLVGGSDANDHITDLGVNGNNQLYVVGFTGSDDFPTTPGSYSQISSGQWDGFISELSLDLKNIKSSTLIGGADYDSILGVSFDNDGSVLISGNTKSTDFPITVGAFDVSSNGSYDAFVSKISSDLTNLLGSTFIGGNGYDTAEAIFVNQQKNVIYVIGDTGSGKDFPVTSGAFDITYNGGSSDAFVAVFGLGILDKKPITSLTPKVLPNESILFTLPISSLPANTVSQFKNLITGKITNLNPTLTSVNGDTVLMVYNPGSQLVSGTYILTLIDNNTGEPFAVSNEVAILPQNVVYILKTPIISIVKGDDLTIKVYPGFYVYDDLISGAFKIQWLDENGQEVPLLPTDLPSKSFTLFLPYTYNTASLSSGVYIVNLIDVNNGNLVKASAKVTIAETTEKKYWRTPPIHPVIPRQSVRL